MALQNGNTLRDEHKLVKISQVREKFLDSGSDTIVNSNGKANLLSSTFKPNHLVLKVERIDNVHSIFYVVTLSSLNYEALPIFMPGQKIALTIKVNNNFYTRAYSLMSNLKDSKSGRYKILIKLDSEDKVSNYLVDGLKVGDNIISSVPFGDFTYNIIRDRKNIIGICDSSGIGAFYSYISSIYNNEIDVNLTLYYTEKLYKNMVFVDELLSFKSNKIKINIVVGDEDIPNTINGFVTASLIKEEFNRTQSIFIAGSEGLYKYLNNELEELKLPKKYIRYDDFLPRCNIRKVQEFTLTIYKDNEILKTKCYNNKTLMNAIEESSFFLPSKCGNGSCGYCLSELVKGKVKIVNDKRNEALKEYHYIHPCATYPLSDIELIVR